MKSLKGTIFHQNQWLEKHEVFFDKGIIIDIKPCTSECSSHLIIPGAVELQVYGTGNYLFSARPSVQYLQEIQQGLMQQGTTSFLMCLATNSIALFQEAIQVLVKNKHLLSNCLGLHLEGPYLNPKKRGAHVENLIKKATLDEVKMLVDSAEGLLKMITIAPECQDEKVIQYLLDQKVIVSVGHSDATFEQATAAYNQGVQTTTHLFNAMSPISHRAPGIPTAVINHPKSMASIIPDGIHVNFEVLKMVKKVMNDRLFMITDAVANCDEGPYQHQFKGDHFVTTDGTLSGSAISMLQGIRNCVHKADIPLLTAVQMATSIPAQLLPDTNIGRIEIGKKANFMELSNDLELQNVYFEGNVVNPA